MFEKATLLYFYTETPLHAGTGDSVSWVDLPIQRERATNHPIIQGSGIKGALRDWARRSSSEPDAGDKIEVVFGPEKEADRFGGSLSTTDARTLLFPVRSFKGVFGWITSPLVLQRWARESGLAGEPVSLPESLNKPLGELDIVINESSALRLDDGSVILEDYAFEVRQDQGIGQLAAYLEPCLPPVFRSRLAGCLALVSDDTFRHFVEFSTEVVTRIRMNETGTVASGALWVQELLPSDTLLYSMALATRPKKKDMGIEDAGEVLEFLTNTVLRENILQLGGDETVGRGLVTVSRREGNMTSAEMTQEAL